MNMSEYQYNPLLKAPDKSTDINMEKPAIVKMMKAMSRAKQGNYFELPQIVKNPVALKKTSYLNSDGQEIALYVITPNAGSCGRHGAMLLLHGGAFALPMQQSAVELGAVYAARCGITVFLPEYSMLPECSGERALLDCIECYKLMQSKAWAEAYDIDSEKIILYGESAGGALAAGAALYIKDHPEEFATQPYKLILIYPVLDNSEEYLSKRKYAEAAWSGRSNSSMWKAYLAGASEDWLRYLVPMRHEDPDGLPETYIEPQEIDILCDEAVEFGRRVRTATVNLIPGSYHSFDADVENPFVQQVIGNRIDFIRA